MPRTDPTFMRDRIANTLAAFDRHPGGLLDQRAADGERQPLRPLRRGGAHRAPPARASSFRATPAAISGMAARPRRRTSLNPNSARKEAFWDATTPAALAAIVDVPGSLQSWTAEALLNDADGYWGGDHNFFIYDQGAKGYVFFPHDLDSSLDYLGRFDSDPITWWSVRERLDAADPAALPDRHRGRRPARAIHRGAARAARALRRRRVAGVDRHLAAGQIRAAVTADPHKPTDLTIADFDDAVALARRGIADRADVRRAAGWPAGTAARAPTPTATASSGATTAATTWRRSTRARRDLRQPRSTTTATASSTTAARSAPAGPIRPAGAARPRWTGSAAPSRCWPASPGARRSRRRARPRTSSACA